MKNRPFHKRLSFASRGIVAAWRRERSFRTQVLLGIAATGFTAVLAPGLLWAAAVALSIALVLALELLNTALECVIDHLHPETAPEIKLAKDIAAGAVLLASIGAVAVGLSMIAAVLLR
jgi:diacylglycerol kinase (ATP)